MKDQAALAADEITADSVRSFVFELDKMNRSSLNDGVNEIITDELSNWDFLGTGFGVPKYIDTPSATPRFKDLSSKILEGGRTFPPQINGKKNKKPDEMSPYLTVDSNLSRNAVLGSFTRPAFLSINREVKASLENWQASKVASWQGSESQSIQWFSVFSLDRKSKSLF